MQTHNLIEDSFFKRKNLTLSHLDEIIEDEMIVENKFKSILAAILLGLSSKADTNISNVDTSIIDQDSSNTALKSLDRAVVVGKKILSTKQPNQSTINDLKIKMETDLDKMFSDVFNVRLTNVNVDKYFPLLMSAYGLTENDSEYLKIKSIVNALSSEIKKIYDTRKDVSQTDKVYLYKIYPLQFYIKLLSQ